MAKEGCYIDINSIGMITGMSKGEVKGIALHNEGSYDYQIRSVVLSSIDAFSMKLRKAKTYEEALVIIKEAGKLQEN